MDSKFTLPYTLLLIQEPRSGFSACCEEVQGTYGSHYKSATVAKRAVRAAAQAKIQEALKAAENESKLVVACKDGTILLVHYGVSAWCYSIAGPNRKYGAGRSSGAETFEETCDWARNHARGCYGGVDWECRT